MTFEQNGQTCEEEKLVRTFDLEADDIPRSRQAKVTVRGSGKEHTDTKMFVQRIVKAKFHYAIVMEFGFKRNVCALYRSTTSPRKGKSRVARPCSDNATPRRVIVHCVKYAKPLQSRHIRTNLPVFAKVIQLYD